VVLDGCDKISQIYAVSPERLLNVGLRDSCKRINNILLAKDPRCLDLENEGLSGPLSVDLFDVLKDNRYLVVIGQLAENFGEEVHRRFVHLVIVLVHY